MPNKIEMQSDIESKEYSDTVVFMTAYDIHNIERRFLHFKRKTMREELWSQFHISGCSYNNTYITPHSKCSYTVECNSLSQIVAVHFENNEYDDTFINEMLKTVYLQHSASVLLDSTLIQVNICFDMEQFLVLFDEVVYQVDPIVYIMNGSLIVNFELINYETGVPLDARSIYGKLNNYGLKHIDKIMYFGDSEFSEDHRKVSDVIFENVNGFLTNLSNDKWKVGQYSFVHNIFVLSREIPDAANYFQKVLGGKIEDFNVKNLSSTDAFNYYSTEYLGVVTGICTGEDRHLILIDCMLLEGFKIFVLLKMIIDYEIHHKLDDVIDHQIYAEGQLYPLHVPIITLNVIDNLKSTYSYSMYKQAIDFKLKTLNIYQERRINSNGRLLNVLLYILALLGSAQTLQVLQTELGLPFDISFWVVMGFFIVFGLVWIIRETKKQ